MKQLIEYFIKYPILGNGLIAVISLFGILSLVNTKTTFLPEFTIRNINITASWSGSSPEEVEEGMIVPIENEIKSITGIKEIISTASENSGSINIEIEKHADIDDVVTEVKNAVERINFPTEMDPVSVAKDELREPAIYTILSGDASLMDLKKEARAIEKDLLAMPGISKMDIYGFPDEEIEIAVNNEILQAYDITIDDISNAVRGNNIKITGGTIKGNQQQLLIRGDNKNYYAEDLKNTIVKKDADGNVVYLYQIANITDQWEDVPNRSYFKGKRSITIIVSSTKNEDLIHTAKMVTDYVENYKNSNGLSLDIMVDFSSIIKERTDILLSSGVQGIILVILILGIFLHFRLAFWVSMVIPVTLLGMFIFGPFYGFTINIMSLMGMILVLGLLVDHGIVIAENIYSKFEEGMPAIQAAIDGSLEVMPSVVGSVLTTMVIFASFFFLEGSIGDEARDIGFVVIVTLALSLVEAMFILPAHIAHSKTLHQKPGKEKHTFFAFIDKGFDWVKYKLYQPVLKFSIASLPNAILMVAIPICFLFITIACVNTGIIKTVFFPTIEHRSINVSLELPSGTVEEITDSLLILIEEKIPLLNAEFADLHDGKDVITHYSRRIFGTNAGSVSVTLMPSDERKVDALTISNSLRDLVGPIPEAEKLTFGGGRRYGAPVAIALYSDDLLELQTAKEWTRTELHAYSFLKDVVDSDSKGTEEVVVELKDIAYTLGFTNQFVMNQVRNSFYGGTIQKLQRGLDEVPVVVRFDEESRRSIDDLSKLSITSPTGNTISLNEIADLTVRKGVSKIKHYNGEKEILIEADLEGTTVGAIDANKTMSEELIPRIQSRFPEIRVVLRGESEESKETTDSTKIIVPIVLFLMYIIVVYTFRSFLQAFIIFLLIPLSIIGIYWGHFIEGFSVSILSMVGTIALLGIIVNDSLVLVGTFNRNLKDKMSFYDALVSAGVNRLRPVILTSLTTIAGLWPLIKNDSFHSNFLSPMAISVGYGLLFGTILTLVVLPSLLYIFNKLKLFLAFIWTGKRLDPRDVEPAVLEDKEVMMLESDKPVIENS